MDKTGTITEGKPKVTDIVVVSPLSSERRGAGGEADILAIMAALERKSEHPLAAAIVQKADESGIPVLEMQDFQAIP